MLDNADALATFFQRADDLKVFPAVAERIREVAEDSRSSVVDLEEVVVVDTALSAYLLKAANSPLYGLRRQVGSLRQALVVLGFDTTRTIALSFALLSTGRHFRPHREQLWRHSVVTSRVIQRLASYCPELGRAEGFSLGMLHDLGELVFAEVERRRYVDLLETSSNGALRLGAERNAFGFCHAELGAACLERWKLPPACCEAVRYHHEPSKVPPDAPPTHRCAAILTHIADTLVYALQAGVSPTDAVSSVRQDEVAKELRITAEDWTAVSVILNRTEYNELSL